MSQCKVIPQLEPCPAYYKEAVDAVRSIITNYVGGGWVCYGLAETGTMMKGETSIKYPRIMTEVGCEKNDAKYMSLFPGSSLYNAYSFLEVVESPRVDLETGDVFFTLNHIFARDYRVDWPPYVVADKTHLWMAKILREYTTHLTPFLSGKDIKTEIRKELVWKNYGMSTEDFQDYVWPFTTFSILLPMVVRGGLDNCLEDCQDEFL